MPTFNRTPDFCDALHHMPMGKDRRSALIGFMRKAVDEPLRICVNRHYCRTLKKDTDLRLLIKRDDLKVIREGITRHRTTYLVLA